MSTAARYYVDLNDGGYPAIREYHENHWNLNEVPITWTEAKREIDEHIASQIVHWQEQRAHWRGMTKPEHARYYEKENLS